MASGARIKRSLLDEADLFGLWAPGSVWEDVSLKGANLTNANLVGSIFRRVDLRDVIGLDAKNTNIEGIVLDDCMLPSGYNYDGFALKAAKNTQPELTD